MRLTWDKVWNQKHGDLKKFNALGEAERVPYLKELDGFDSVSGNMRLTAGAFEKQYRSMKERLCYGREASLETVYEIGCGSGATLYQFERDGVRTGGVDYAGGLIEVAKGVLRTDDLLCAEATEFPTGPQYDCVFSN